LEHLLFAAYLILFSWLVTKTRFFTKTGLSAAQLIILFLLKVMAGIAYGWIGVYYGQQLQMVDTWYFHYNSLEEYELLLKHPSQFVGSFFENRYEQGFSKFLTSKDSWWNDIKYIALEKLLAIFNVLSFGNYYTNVIFYSYLTFFGPIAIYRVMKDVFPESGFAVIAGTFLIPSFLFWASGIHKDGLIFLSFALITYHIYFGVKEKRFSAKRFLFIALALFLLIFRSFVVILLFPALLAWLLSLKTRRHPLLVFSLTYIFFGTLFFTAHYINPQFNFLEAVAQRQDEFLQLYGNSSVKVNVLEPSFIGFLKNTPQAVSLTIFRPFITDVNHLFSLAAFTELYILLFLIVLFIFYRKPKNSHSAFILYCFFFSISMLLMVGFTINILGAIVRYRSIVLPFIMIPIIARTDWSKLWNHLSKHIIKFNKV
jgi:hypothetical protein